MNGLVFFLKTSKHIYDLVSRTTLSNKGAISYMRLQI